MIKDSIEEFFSRIRSPFFLTFIIVWCFWNYDIFVAIYDINEFKDTEERISTIGKYIRNNLWHLTVVPFGISIGSLIIYYIGATLGLFVKEFYRIKIKSTILDWIKPMSDTMPMDEYNRLDKYNGVLRNQLTSWKRLVQEAEQEKDAAQSELRESDKKLVDLQGKFDKASSANDSLNVKIHNFEAVERKNLEEINTQRTKNGVLVKENNQLHDVLEKLEQSALNDSTIEAIFFKQRITITFGSGASQKMDMVSIKKNDFYQVNDNPFLIKNVKALKDNRYIEFEQTKPLSRKYFLIKLGHDAFTGFTDKGEEINIRPTV